MNYSCKSIPDDIILYEFKGDFNIKAYEDDSFDFGDQFHVYFQTSMGFFRTIKSPFYLGDVFKIGQLSERKKHTPVGSIRVFLFYKEVLYSDAWSLQYDFQRKISDLENDYFGEYKFLIESPLTFLEQSPKLFGTLKDLTLIEFSSRFNQLIQHDVITILQTFIPQSPTQELEGKLFESIKNKLDSLGIVLTQFNLNSSKTDVRKKV